MMNEDFNEQLGKEIYSGKFLETDEVQKRLDQGLCPNCMSALRPIDVHGHTQCPTCKCVIQDCCQGEVADE